MSNNRPIFKLGTAVQIDSIINEDTASSATITIKNPSETALTSVTGVAMTKVVDKTYRYIWQSSSTDVEGTYKAIVSITIGAYTGVATIDFTMEKA